MCMHVYMHIYKHVYVCIYICTYVYVYVYKHTICTAPRTRDTRASQISTPYLFMYICIFVYVYIYIYIYIYICIYVCVYIYTYIYICIYTQTYDLHSSSHAGHTGFANSASSILCLPTCTCVFICATWFIQSCDMTYSIVRHDSFKCATWLILMRANKARGAGLGSRPKKMYGERLGDGVEYHLMSPTPRR